MGVAREIKAIIRQPKLQDVLVALRRIPDLPEVTVSLVRGYGPLSASESSETDPRPMYMLQVLVGTAMAEAVVEAILSAGSTGEAGDGRIQVSDVAEVADIRKRTRGLAAL